MKKKSKTPEEQAYEYACPAAKALYRQGFIKEEWLRNMLEQAYLTGHETAIKNQWRGATDYPLVDEDVLIDCPDEYSYAIGFYDGESWHITATGRQIQPTHWMPIPSN